MPAGPSTPSAGPPSRPAALARPVHQAGSRGTRVAGPPRACAPSASAHAAAISRQIGLNRAPSPDASPARPESGFPRSSGAGTRARSPDVATAAWLPWINSTRHLQATSRSAIKPARLPVRAVGGHRARQCACRLRRARRRDLLRGLLGQRCRPDAFARPPLQLRHPEVSELRDNARRSRLSMPDPPAPRHQRTKADLRQQPFVRLGVVSFSLDRYPRPTQIPIAPLTFEW